MSVTSYMDMFINNDDAFISDSTSSANPQESIANVDSITPEYQTSIPEQSPSSADPNLEELVRKSQRLLEDIDKTLNSTSASSRPGSKKNSLDNVVKKPTSRQNSFESRSGRRRASSVFDKQSCVDVSFNITIVHSFAQ